MESPRPTVPALPAFTVYPLRFTADAPAMIAFLRTLGMAPVVTSPGEGFGELVAGGGRVMIHGVHGAGSGARPGDTDLCLSVPETDEAAVALRAMGIEVDVWDETYGRQGVIALPGGEGIGLNEHQRDLYGYQGHDASASDPRLSVVAVLQSVDFEADARWAAQLGFRAEAPGAGDGGFRTLRGRGSAGSIGLHAPFPGGRRSRPTGTEFGDSLQVRLGFETGEDLEGLAARLIAAEYPARVIDSGARSVRVEDPDGQCVEIRPRPATRRG